MKSNSHHRIFWVVITLVSICPIVANGTTYTVTTTADLGPGTLRWAITTANANPGADTIDFNIGGPGPYTIAPFSALDTIVDPVYIDGYTQPGAVPNTQPQGVPTDAVLMIEVTGVNVPGVDGFHIHSSDVVIRGLCVNQFWNGICICSGPQDCQVLGCYVGTDIMGTFEHGSNTRTGVSIQYGSAENAVGGTSLADRNVISGWDFGQVDVVGLGSDNNVIYGNYIGTDKDGLGAIGNLGAGGNGVSIYEGPVGSPTFNLVGGPNDTERNVISGNPWEGIEIAGPGDLYNTVENNYIGVNVLGSPLGNGFDGVILMDCTKKNIIGPDNVIAHNIEDGIELIHGFCDPSDDTDFNEFHRNFIYDNGQLGIDLGGDEVTPNDPGDPDTGQNEGLNFPVVTDVLYNPYTNQTVVNGWIDIDTDPTLAEVEIFQAAVDPTGYGEGMTYLGSAFPDGMGDWSASITSVSPGSNDSLTTTTTDMNGNTSEFSECVRIPQPGCIAGMVTDTTTPVGVPLEGALVEVFLGAVLVADTTTDASGGYHIEPLGPATYDAVASKAGYLPDTVTGIVVAEGCILVNFALEPASGTQFIRADANNDTTITMGDAIYTLKYLYVPGSPDPSCMKTADSDDSGEVAMSDAIYTLKHLYVPGSPPPPAPFPGCGMDGTPDGLDCLDHLCP